MSSLLFPHDPPPAFRIPTIKLARVPLYQPFAGLVRYQGNPAIMFDRAKIIVGTPIKTLSVSL